MNTAWSFAQGIRMPEMANSIFDLKEWLKGRQNLMPNTIQEIVYDRETSFVAVMVDTSSGVSTVDAYIYVCSKHACSLLAMRSTDAASLKLVFLKEKNELMLISPDDHVYLTIPLHKHR